MEIHICSLGLDYEFGSYILHGSHSLKAIQFFTDFIFLLTWAFIFSNSIMTTILSWIIIKIMMMLQYAQYVNCECIFFCVSGTGNWVN
jgi:hypothetical protein